MREEEVYKKASALGLEKFFAKTERAGSIVGADGAELPYYKQERVPEISKSRKVTKEEEEITKSLYEDVGYRAFTQSWLIDAIKYYGATQCLKLLAFLRNERIGDFHSENIGYRSNGEPVLFDYSGYNED